MTIEEFIQKRNEIKDFIRKIELQKERQNRAINDAMDERIKAAREWAEDERRKVYDVAYTEKQCARAELTRLHFEFHGTENQQSLLQN